MTKRSTVTQAQLRAAARIAKEHGVSIRLEPNGSATISPSSAPADDQSEWSLEDLAQKSVQQDAKRGHWSQHRRSAKAAASTDTFAEDLAKLDPHSRKVISGGYIWDYQEFQAHIVTKPLNRREIVALEVLAKFGVGSPASFRQVNIGLETQERLEARGYLETRPQERFPDRVGYYILTETGRGAWEAHVRRQ